MLDGADNVKTMALIDAGYRSMEEKRTVHLSEFNA
jgi:predicted dehydrogenase